MAKRDLGEEEEEGVLARGGWGVEGTGVCVCVCTSAGRKAVKSENTSS